MKAAARFHRERFERYVSDVGINVTVRQPRKVEAPSTDVEKVLGTSGAETEPGDAQTVRVIWSNDLRPNAIDNHLPSKIASLARQGSVDVFIRAILRDVLHDPADPNGLTLFDTAFDVLQGTARFKVLDTDRTGLPPEGPYVLWVALRREW